MESLRLKIKGIWLDVDGCAIEPSEEYGQIGYDFEIFDVSHNGESIFELLDGNMINLITSKSIETYKEFQISKELKED